MYSESAGERTFENFCLWYRKLQQCECKILKSHLPVMWHTKSGGDLTFENVYLRREKIVAQQCERTKNLRAYSSVVAEYVAVCCSVLQYVAVCCSVIKKKSEHTKHLCVMEYIYTHVHCINILFPANNILFLCIGPCIKTPVRDRIYIYTCICMYVCIRVCEGVCIYIYRIHIYKNIYIYT